ALYSRNQNAASPRHPRPTDCRLFAAWARGLAPAKTDAGQPGHLFCPPHQRGPDSARRAAGDPDLAVGTGRRPSLATLCRALLEALPAHGDWRILISPDHRTPVRTRAHAHGAVPFALAGTGIASKGQRSYDEAVAGASDWAFDKGHELMRHVLG